MSTADATFDALWSRTGMAEQPDHPPGQTVRGPPLTTTHGSHVPRLSIGDPGAGGEPTAAQLIVEGLLGEGGMGQVHLARQPLLDREVAIKRVRPDAPRAAAMSLFREARVMGSLEHPNILPVHALGADDHGRPILVMKRLNGVEWAELIGRDDHPAWAWWTGIHTEPLVRHVELLIHLCRAAHFAHERGVVHLDLKPENAMLADDGGVYMLDWGIARRLDDEVRRGVAGTPAYMAPELVDPSRPLSRATDVYLLGACLHHVLTGEPPHTGESLKEVMGSAWLSRPPALEGAPPDLAAICTRAMAADPAARFPTALALQQALTEWIRTRGSARLAERALESAVRLEALLAGSEPDPVAISHAFAEARFGFERALEQWPDNPSAREGLHRIRRKLAAFEIGRENLDQAASLLADLGGDEALEAQLARVRERVEARRQLERESDLGVARTQRSLFIATLGLLGFVVSAVILGGVFGDPGEFTTFGVLMVGLAFNVAIWLLVAVGRRWLFRNAVNGAITWSVIGMSGIVLVGRLAGHLSGAEVAQLFTQDLMVLASSLLVGAAFLRARGVAVAGALLVGMGLFAALNPEWAIALFGWGTTTGFAVGAVYWYRLGRSPEGPRAEVPPGL